jgi:transposase-like protein
VKKNEEYSTDILLQNAAAKDAKTEYGKETSRLSCPKCNRSAMQNKCGSTASGSPRLKCVPCGSKYVITLKAKRYSEEERQKFKKISTSTKELSVRAISIKLKIPKSTIQDWKDI